MKLTGRLPRVSSINNTTENIMYEKVYRGNLLISGFKLGFSVHYFLLSN